MKVNTNNDILKSVLAAVASGLYPMLFYFTNNYTIVNTWGHVWFFMSVFIVAPIIGFVIINSIFSRDNLKKYKKYVLPFLNVFWFLFFLMICHYAGINKVVVIIIFVCALVFSILLNKHFKKIIQFEFLLALIGVFTLGFKAINYSNFSSKWQKQPDNITSVIFKKKPNVYFIQPDGYANFSVLRKKPYAISDTNFENFLEKENFKYYTNFRSNYGATLSSNSATFMMKQHYYNDEKNLSESINARSIIISKNPILEIFKNNGYKTHFISELPYLLLNKPALGYDFCNFDLDKISYISTGLGDRQDILLPLKKELKKDKEISKFFFIEIFNPGHIHGRELESEGIEDERTLWIEGLETANEILKKTITTIKANDPNALIIIMADHGGYVGFKSTSQAYYKTQNKDLIYSIFSSTLAIHWPQNKAPEYDRLFKTSVNVFRILFSYLSEDENYLKNLQPDKSFMILKDANPEGVYEYIDENGEITLKKH